MIPATRAAQPTPLTPEGIGSGTKAVRSVSSFLLEQHYLIDCAENNVQAYRRLESHLQFELAFVLEIRRPSPGASGSDGYDADIEKIADLGRRFRLRRNPYGTAPSFKPTIGSPENTRYMISIGDFGPKSIVMGQDLPAGLKALLEPYRDAEFQRASQELSDIHLRGHRFMDRYGMMKFTSAFSNAAPTQTDESWARSKDDTEVQLNQAEEGLFPDTPDEKEARSRSDRRSHDMDSTVPAEDYD